jgi:ATP-binding cassette subfamily B protein
MSDKKNMDWNVLVRIVRLAIPYRTLFIVTFLLAIVLAPVSIIRPMLINRMVDDYILKSDLTGLQMMAWILVGVLLVESVMQYMFIYNSNLLGQSVVKDLRVRMFRHILSLKPAFFDKTPVGLSTTRTINDIETINSVFSQGLITIMADLLGIIAVVSIMLITSWKLTLVCLIALPFMIWGSYIFKEKVKKAFQIVRTKIADMNAFLQERISGMKVVQMFNAEEQEIKKFKKINRDYTQANLKTVFYYAVFFPFVELISAVSIGLMVWYGAKGVMNMQITPGVLVVFPIYIGMLYRPVRMIADRFNTLQMGMVAGERVFKVIDTTDVIEDSGTLKPVKFDGNVEFKNVEFSYNPGYPILKNISFNLPSGKTMAIVGSTGSGKSTIINLLNRFYEIDGGSIMIDGTDIREYDLPSLRSRIAIVLQDVFLYTGPLMDNITLKHPDISEADVIAASKMIGAHKFFIDLPGGYKYELMERGANLSMGQRQLISFVRALVFNPDILILDEATSSIDSETEAVIQNAIEKLTEKRSSIIIAHRLSTIRHAHHIIVMDSGQVVEQGAPEDLLKIENGRYRDLYEKQLIEQEA